MDLANLGFRIDSSGLRRATGDLDRLDGQSRTTTSSIKKLATGFVALGAAAAITSTIKGSITSFAEFERGLIGVGKTTNIAGSELADLGQSVRELSRDLPVSSSKLLEVAQSAGQLGVSGTDNILRFTETVGKLGLATDLSGDQAATSFARILTVTGTAISEVDRLGSTIVQLGNNFAATESEIAAVATRVSQSTSQFDVSAAQVLGISTALKAVGVQAESGGTQVGLAFQAINDAIRNGGDELARLEKITGRTGDALREDFFNGNSAKVFQDFVNGLGQIQQSGGDVSASLEAMGLKGVRATQVLGTLATRTDVLADALSQANREWDSNIALNKEAAIASGSFSAQLQLVGNAADEAASAVGSIIAPAALDGLDSFRDASLFVADNIDTLAKAGKVLALVIGTRLTGALVASTASLILGTAAAASHSAAVATQTQIELAYLRTLQRSLVAQLANSTSTVRSIVLRAELAANTVVLTAANNTLTTSLAGSTVAARVATGAMAGLRASMAFLGGPLGVFVIAASAAFVFREELFGTSRQLNRTEEDVKALADRMDDLTGAELRHERTGIERKLRDTAVALANARKEAERTAKAQSDSAAGSMSGIGDISALTDMTHASSVAADLSAKSNKLSADLVQVNERIAEVSTKSAVTAMEELKASKEEASAAIAKIIAALQAETRELTLTDAQLLQYKLATLDASGPQTTLAVSILKTNEGLREQAATQAALVEGADRFAESIKTPTQLYDEQIVKLNEWRSTIDEATGKALISVAQYQAGVKLAGDELEDMNDKTEESKGLFGDLQSASERWSASFADSLVEGGLNFEKFANGILKQLQKIALEKAFAPVFDAFATGLGSIGSGASIGTGNSPMFDNSVGPSFAGGGSTGGGSRSGGVDGIGGFPAILHPNETVTDNTKGQKSSSSAGIVVYVDASESSATGDQDGKQLGDMIGVAVRSVLIDESRPGGLLS